MNHIKGDLIAYWSKGEEDIIFNSTGDSVNGRRLVYHAFCVVKMNADLNAKNFLDELEARGYDLKTLRFSIDRKENK